MAGNGTADGTEPLRIEVALQRLAGEAAERAALFVGAFPGGFVDVHGDTEADPRRAACVTQRGATDITRYELGRIGRIFLKFFGLLFGELLGDHRAAVGNPKVFVVYNFCLSHFRHFLAS
jgi:hypothetical protein